MNVLREAYDLIRDEERWTVEYAATDRQGEPVAPGSTEAVRWCAVGALVRCAGWTAWSAGERNWLESLAKTMFPDLRRYSISHVMGVNDELGHDAVMQLFEKALIQQEGSL